MVNIPDNRKLQALQNEASLLVESSAYAIALAEQ